MRYEILGPLRLIDGERTSFIGARKIEALLVTLLIRSDHVVGVEHLMAEIWGNQPPREAGSALHVYISKLRKHLRGPERKENPIVTRPQGYMLRLGADEIDFHAFVRLADRGRAYLRAGEREKAAESLERALTLWRGTMTTGSAHGPIVDGFRRWLLETRLECTDLLMETHLALGHHRELVGRLFSLITEHPLQEGFYRQLMLALYRADRKADALNVYQTARRILREELGLEPCRALQDLERGILTADPSLDLVRRDQFVA